MHAQFAQAAPSARTTIHINTSLLRVLAVTLALTGNLFPAVGGVSLAAVGLVVAVVFAIGDLARYLPRLHPVLTLVLGLSVLLSGSLLWTDPPNAYGVDKVTSLLTITMLSALIAVTIRDAADVSALAAWWPIVLLPVALASLLSFEGGRATGFDSNAIWVGRALATGLICVAWQLWHGQARSRALPTLGMIAVLSGALIATGSRGPILGLAVGIMILTLVAGSGRFVKIASIVVAGTVAWFFVFSTDFFSSSRLVEWAEEGRFTDSNQRDVLFSRAVDIAREHPAGVGIGNVNEYWLVHHKYPHNIFIEVFAEHGWIVGAIFMGVVAMTMIRLLRHARHNRYVLLLAALFAAEIVNVSVSGDLNARSFFFFLALSVWVVFWATRDQTPSVPIARRDAPGTATVVPMTATRPSHAGRDAESRWTPNSQSEVHRVPLDSRRRSRR